MISPLSVPPKARITCPACGAPKYRWRVIEGRVVSVAPPGAEVCQQCGSDKVNATYRSAGASRPRTAQMTEGNGESRTQKEARLHLTVEEVRVTRDYLSEELGQKLRMQLGYTQAKKRDEVLRTVRNKLRAYLIEKAALKKVKRTPTW